LARRFAPQRARLDRLGEMGHRARLAQRLADEQPARAGLDRHVNLALPEPLYPATHGVRIRRDPTAGQLARFAVQRIEGDLRSVHVEPGYDRHRGLL
jgi:hypothetical protein